MRLSADTGTDVVSGVRFISGNMGFLCGGTVDDARFVEVAE